MWLKEDRSTKKIALIVIKTMEVDYAIYTRHWPKQTFGRALLPSS
jgi:hypothetical protein